MNRGAHSLLLALLVFSALPVASDHHHPRTETVEVLLSTEIIKWHDVELHRILRDGKVLGYQWVEVRHDNDRRGPNTYRKSQTCFLFCHADHVKVLMETPKVLDLRFDFQGSGKKSLIRVTYEPRDDGSFHVEGGGELYDEFTEKLQELTEASGPDPTDPNLPRLSWSYHPRPVEEKE